MYPIEYNEYTLWDKQYSDEYLPLYGRTTLCLKGDNYSIATKIDVVCGRFNTPESPYKAYMRGIIYDRYLNLTELRL